MRTGCFPLRKLLSAAGICIAKPVVHAPAVFCARAVADTIPSMLHHVCCGPVVASAAGAATCAVEGRGIESDSTYARYQAGEKPAHRTAGSERAQATNFQRGHMPALFTHQRRRRGGLAGQPH